MSRELHLEALGLKAELPPVEAPTPLSQGALASLCQTYWHPVYAFVRRNGYDRDQAQDLTQGFLAVLLEKNYLLDPIVSGVDSDHSC